MKLKITIFFGFVLLSLAVCKIHLDKDIDLKFEWEIIAKFMEDQHVVTLFVEQNYEDFGHRILKYSVKNFNFGLFYYNNVKLISQFWRSFQKIAMYTERIYGAIIITQDHNLMDMLVKVSGNNKIVLVLFDLDIPQIKIMLQRLWDKHKSFNMLTLSIHSNGTNLIILQNPFQSKLYQYHIDKINSSKNFVQLLNHQYTEFMSNMHGYQLKIFIFDFPLISMPIKNKTGHVIGYTGMHGTMLKLTSHLMNYTPIYVQDSSGPGSMFGLSSASVIEDGRAEIGFNGRFVLGKSFNNTVYLYPMAKVAFVFIVPINYEEKPLELFAYFFFDVTSRIYIGCSLIITTGIWLLGIFVYKNNAETATTAIPLKVLALIHSVSVKIPKKAFNQIIFVTIAFFGLLLASVYQGMVVKHLSTPFKPHQLETLNDLLNSNLDIATFTYVKGKIVKDSIEDSNNLLIMGDIGRKSVIQYDEAKQGLDMVAYNKTTALLMPQMFFTPYSVQYFNTTTGLDLVHSINEPSTTMFVSYVIARNSPYIKAFNGYAKMCIEAGFMQRDVSKAMYFKDLLYIRRIKNGYIPEEQKITRPIKLSDMILVQYFLFICIGVSIIVFLLEHVVYFIEKCYVKRKLIGRVDY